MRAAWQGWGSARGERLAKGSGAVSSADVLRPAFLSTRRDKGPLSVTVSGRDHPLHHQHPTPSKPPTNLTSPDAESTTLEFLGTFSFPSPSLICHLPRSHIYHSCDITGEKPPFPFPLLLQEKSVRVEGWWRRRQRRGL